MTINTAAWPLSASAIADGLRAVGVEHGMTLIVHSSVKSLGHWIIGGPAAIVLALEEALGKEGTLVMPAQSGDLSEPSRWCNPPVPESWWQAIREEMPPFQADLTPTFGMGAVVECFRAQEGTYRSNHPQVSFCARGPKASSLTAHHELAYGLGEGSPLAKLYDSNAMVLLLGVGYDKNTSIHLAEYRANYGSKATIVNGAPVVEDGCRQWVTFDDVEISSDDFNQVGEAFEQATGLVKQGRIGEATVKLMPMRALVDYAVTWMEQHR
ncbi:aminoglycoside 3-N-acetyltransferase [Paenibacillus phyllosphaerae]|uniref:Aminoglycoside N(3)-acetyltransferase n=1 Tax=Paenibacillus phyllosphaerae TaxID=274593 RepID=A0A7W5B2Z3_9BACL|nr:AAC(3) family N-acetyltransferase [Paenibacillus phyllosphaerae]MBB3113479.1 aminoglycoside 3-N-acetyltransferase [Paenibacillus phyllosphaerae]